MRFAEKMIFLNGTNPATYSNWPNIWPFLSAMVSGAFPCRGTVVNSSLFLEPKLSLNSSPPEVAVDIEQATDYGGDGDEARPAASHHRVREEMIVQADDLPENSLRGRVVEELLTYLKERNQEECADYFTLRLLDLPTQEIETLLGLTPRERDYLQQRFKYHLLRFALSHHWELVHEWLEAGLEKKPWVNAPAVATV